MLLLFLLTGCPAKTEENDPEFVGTWLKTDATSIVVYTFTKSEIVINRNNSGTISTTKLSINSYDESMHQINGTITQTTNPLPVVGTYVKFIYTISGKQLMLSITLTTTTSEGPFIKQ